MTKKKIKSLLEPRIGQAEVQRQELHLTPIQVVRTLVAAGSWYTGRKLDCKRGAAGTTPRDFDTGCKCPKGWFYSLLLQIPIASDY